MVSRQGGLEQQTSPALDTRELTPPSHSRATDPNTAEHFDLSMVGLSRARLGRLLLVHALAVSELTIGSHSSLSASTLTEVQGPGTDSLLTGSTTDTAAASISGEPALETEHRSPQRSKVYLDFVHIPLSHNLFWKVSPIVGKLNFSIKDTEQGALMEASLPHCMKSEYKGMTIKMLGRITEASGGSAFVFSSNSDSIMLPLDGFTKAKARALKRDDQHPPRLEIELQSHRGKESVVQVLTITPLGDFKKLRGDVVFELSQKVIGERNKVLTRSKQGPITVVQGSFLTSNSEPGAI